MTATGILETQTPTAATKAAQAKPESSTLHSLILKSLDDDGATEVVAIDLAGKSSEADRMVIASGRSTRHVGAIAEKLIDRLKHEAGVMPKAEGLDAADWVLIDAGDVIVHVFRPEVREFYQLEKMWTTAPDATARPAALG
ncbi:MAG: ribosome silencing factor [Pseudomonadota bacterium]